MMNMEGLLKSSSKIFIYLFILVIFSCQKSNNGNESENINKKEPIKFIKLFVFPVNIIDKKYDTKYFVNDSIFAFQNESYEVDGKAVAGSYNEVFINGKKSKKLHIKDIEFITKKIIIDSLAKIDFNNSYKSQFKTNDYKIIKKDKNFYLYLNENYQKLPMPFLLKNQPQPHYISFNSLEINNDKKPELFIFESNINPMYNFIEGFCTVYQLQY